MNPLEQPVPFCDVTCPRQLTRAAADCECGGAQRHRDAIIASRAQGPNRPNPNVTPQPQRPDRTTRNDDTEEQDT